ncbi:hypothetical protein PBCV1_a553L [Paramecium bursaria Chlorella virus 1]|uniref:Uncharacterized protein n=1 Tax=Paramecium bursaria Chlorella virus 1 TaxID=10506 RepID=O41035_PBCV1|nr:hypothetical protein PBCV1_a553L [Paramecium bursaria Chlorella virus 1]AAC96998.1 hypothetical protein [Paramecium bursaria Chlorella virus 1]
MSSVIVFGGNAMGKLFRSVTRLDVLIMFILKSSRTMRSSLFVISWMNDAINDVMCTKSTRLVIPVMWTEPL